MPSLFGENYVLSFRRSTYPLLLCSVLYKQCKLAKMFVVKAIMSAIFHSGTFSLFPGKCLHVLPVYHLMLYTINNTQIRHMNKAQILLSKQLLLKMLNKLNKFTNITKIGILFYFLQTKLNMKRDESRVFKIFISSDGFSECYQLSLKFQFDLSSN